ncbi:mitochondrial import translocase subunit Tom22 [Hysterangium stoloniferum]|nr:mitochondrial import translocase subunit Tom22 [Hysterangium stoloniferum]
MVKVEIVDEKEATPNSPYASSSSSRTASTASLSSISSDVPENESIIDRIAALVDIVPPTTRQSISSKISKTTSFVFSTGKFLGNVAWVVSTSALIVALPLVLILDDEGRYAQQEAEELARQQGRQGMTGSGSASPIDPNQPRPQGIVPPGF